METEASSIGQKPAGFTALELILAISVAAILLVIGVPAFQGFGARQRMSAATNALHAQLVLAREEAIRANAHVIICPGTLDHGCIGTGDWSNGWIVFNDFNGDGQFQKPETVYRVEAGMEQIVIRSSSGRSRLRFSPNGSAPGSNGSISFCDWRGPANARKLVISNTGRIRRDEAPELDAQDCPPTNG